MRLRTVLRPGYGMSPTGVYMHPDRRKPVTLDDYLIVPAIQTFGTWSFKELVPFQGLVRLAVIANELEKAQSLPSGR